MKRRKQCQIPDSRDSAALLHIPRGAHNASSSDAVIARSQQHTVMQQPIQSKSTSGSCPRTPSNAEQVSPTVCAHTPARTPPFKHNGAGAHLMPALKHRRKALRILAQQLQQERAPAARASSGVCVCMCVCARTEHGSHTESLSAMERTCRTHLAFILFDSSCPSLLCPFAYPCALLHIMRRTPVLARLHCARTPLHRGTAWPGRRTGPRPRTTGTKAAQRTDTLAHKEGPGPGAQGARRTHIHARTHRGA